MSKIKHSENSSTDKKTGSTKPSSRYEDTASILDQNTVSRTELVRRDDGISMHSEDRANNPMTDMESVETHS